MDTAFIQTRNSLPARQSSVMSQFSDCSKRFLHAGVNIYAAVFGSLGGVLVLCGIAVLVIRSMIQKTRESLWKIKLEDIIFDDPPTILGKLTCKKPSTTLLNGCLVVIYELCYGNTTWNSQPDGARRKDQKCSALKYCHFFQGHILVLMHKTYVPLDDPGTDGGLYFEQS